MDVRTARMVVVALAVLCGLSLFGTVLLTALGIQSPPALGAIIGTTFGILIGLPIVPRGDRESSDRSSRKASASGVILAVDDSEGVRMTLERVLGGEGYDVRSVATAEEGLQLIRAGFKPDLILLDMLLSGMDGNGFLKELKAIKGEFPVIVLSAWPDQLETALVDRVSATMRKPPNVAELVQVVGSYMRKRSA